MAFTPALVTLTTFRDPWDAYFLRGRLAAEGIPAFVLNDQHIHVDWLISTALGGVRVQVPAHLMADAQAVWDGVVDGDYRNLLVQLFGDIDERRCPVCGATAVRRRPTIGEIVIGILTLIVFSVPLKLAQRRCACRACGARWQEA